jgi:hypothetical protein
MVPRQSGRARHGYPHWFHFVTGSLELTTAVLLAQGRTRLLGSALGCAVMLAALATVTLHGEYGHGVAPLVVATLSIVVGRIAWRKQLPRPARLSPLDVNGPRLLLNLLSGAPHCVPLAEDRHAPQSATL